MIYFRPESHVLWLLPTANCQKQATKAAPMPYAFIAIATNCKIYSINYVELSFYNFYFYS